MMSICIIDGGNRMEDECTECEVECQNKSKQDYANCPCQVNCPAGCPCPDYQCSNSTVSTTTATFVSTTTAPIVGKDVLVLVSDQQPMVISFDGYYREALFESDSDTSTQYSCSVQYENVFYILGGDRIGNQVNK